MTDQFDDLHLNEYPDGELPPEILAQFPANEVGSYRDPVSLDPSVKDDKTYPSTPSLEQRIINGQVRLIFQVCLAILVVAGIIGLVIYVDILGQFLVISLLAGVLSLITHLAVKNDAKYGGYYYRRFQRVRNELMSDNETITPREFRRRMHGPVMPSDLHRGIRPEKDFRAQLPADFLPQWQSITIGTVLMCVIFGLVFYGLIDAQSPTSERNCYLRNTSNLDIRLTDNDGQPFGILAPNQSLKIDYSTSKNWYIAATGERFNQKISGEDFDHGYVDSQYLRLTCREVEING